MRRRQIWALVAASLIAACGSENATPAPKTATSTTPSRDAPSAPTTSATTTVDATVPTMLPEPSSTMVPAASTATESTPATEPLRDLRDPWPATAIDWETIGPGWLLFTYAVPDALDDPAAEYDVTLMLLSPTGDTYEVGRLPGPYPLAHNVHDLSSNGRTALVASYADEATSFSLLDLPAMSMTTIPTPPTAWGIRFSLDDQSVLVEERSITPQPSGGRLVERIGLSRAGLDGTSSQSLVELPLIPEQQQLGQLFSYVELDSGEIATTEAGVAWLRSQDGQPIRQLQLPTDQCSLVKQWPDGNILARCPDTSADVGCWTNGLFLISANGEAPVEFAMPNSTPEASACFAGYTDAVPLNDQVALQRGQGEGECTQRIELTDGTSTSTWTPDNERACNATLLGIRNEAWLVHVRPSHGTHGSHHEGPGVLYEINPLGYSRPLTPTTLPSSWNTPGIMASARIVES